MVGHQRIEEELGRQARCPKHVSQGGDDEAGRDASAKDQASHGNRERLKSVSAQRTRTHAFWYDRFRPSGKHIIPHQKVDVSGAWDPTSRDPEVMEGGRSEQG